MILLLAGQALAVDADTLLARVAEVASHRELRRAEHAPSFSEDDYRRAADGRVVTGVMPVDGHKAKVGYGLAVLDVGVEALWGGINSELHHGELVPISHVELVGGSECADGRKVLMVLPLPWIKDRYWVNENAYNAPLAAATAGSVRELSWSSVADPAAETMTQAGRDAIDGLVAVGFNRGAWLLIGLDAGHTLVEYHSWVDPGGSVPLGPASLFATSGIEDTFEAMERYASGTPFCGGAQ